ncbi:MAG: glycosyltransferase [Candidatus Binatia bacterium]
MQLARGALCLFADADGATPIRELEKLEQPIGKGADIVIGSRARHSPECTLDARWRRKFFGRIFHGSVRLGRVRKIVDTQCGFKLFKAQVAKNLFFGFTYRRIRFCCRAFTHSATARIHNCRSCGELARPARKQGTSHHRRPSHGTRASNYSQESAPWSLLV